MQSFYHPFITTYIFNSTHSIRVSVLENFEHLIHRTNRSLDRLNYRNKSKRIGVGRWLNSKD